MTPVTTLPFGRPLTLADLETRLEPAGVPSYWLVGPDEASLMVRDVRDGAYVRTARGAGGVVPADLLA